MGINFCGTLIINILHLYLRPKIKIIKQKEQEKKQNGNTDDIQLESVIDDEPIIKKINNLPNELNEFHPPINNHYETNSLSLSFDHLENITLTQTTIKEHHHPTTATTSLSLDLNGG